MTQEEKQLLLVDLCSRLPYKVKCSYERILPEGYLLSDAQTIGTMDSITIPFVEEITVKIDGLLRGLSDFKMYLRPLSSMTEEERKELSKLCNFITFCHDYDDFGHLGIEILTDLYDKDDYYIDNNIDMRAIDWLNQHHFD